MHAASRQALATLREQFPAVAARFSSVDGLNRLADELYSVSALLLRNPQLRRLLADSSTAAERRGGLVDQLLGSQLSASAVTVVRDAVALRWSSPWDLVDGLELIADDSLLQAAEQSGALDDVEDELFRFERILDAESNLTTLLDEVTVAPARRVALLDSIVASKVNPITRALLAHAVGTDRKRGITFATRSLLEEAALRRRRSLARVLSAVPLSDVQQTRLAATLTEMYGRAITILVAIEPEVVGGLVVQVGDEVIDGSVAAKLNSVRSALAG
ncbi:MAG: F0F1 ATP synthase subunit delta [Actinobacteria bacterium]|nr:F0F1 ATP synthase subunit delta [Actinomycetota bacterium]